MQVNKLMISEPIGCDLLQPLIAVEVQPRWGTDRTTQLLLWQLYWIQGAVSIRKTVLPGMAIPMLKIRRPNGRLIFNMEIAIRR